MKPHSILSATAASTALVLCVASGTTASAATAKPAAGSAKSVLSLLQVTAAGHTVRIGDLTLSSDTLTGKALSHIDLTPLVADGTALGKQTITPSSQQVTVPAQTTPSALDGILSLASPVLSASATSAPSSKVTGSSLGTLKVLGLPLSLAGSLDLGSAVSSTTGALGVKNLVVKDLALPSIGDLLKALGLDLTALPVTTLNTLIDQLGLVTSAISTAQAAASSALAQLTTATAAVTSATSALSQATAGLTAPTAALQSLLSQIPAANLIGLPGANTVTGFLALPAVTQSLLAGLVPGTSSALNAVTLAQGVVTTATSALATAQSALTSLTSTLQGLIAPLVTLLTGALDSTPLLSLGSLSITSKAAASSNKPGGQQAEVLGGTLTGLKVLGQDVLDKVLGTSSINLVDLVGTTATQVTTTINGLTGTLSRVLSTVPGLPRLSIPAPQITLLTKSASTSISGGFGRALTSVTGLKIALPAITLPSAVALPGASSLPGLSLVSGLLTSSPLSLSLGTVSDEASFEPAVLATTPTVVPGAPLVVPPTAPAELPHTGLPAGLAALSVLSLLGAVALRRRARV